MAEGESLRFPALQISVNQCIEEQKNKQTSKTRQDVGLLSKFLKSKPENRKIEEIQPQELNDFLSELIVTLKREGGVAKTRVRVPPRVRVRVRDCYYKKKKENVTN